MNISQDEIPMSLVTSETLQDEALEDVSPNFVPVPEPMPITPEKPEPEPEPVPPTPEKQEIDSRLDFFLSDEHSEKKKIQEDFIPKIYYSFDPLNEVKGFHSFLLLLDMFFCFFIIFSMIEFKSFYSFLDNDLGHSARLGLEIGIPIISLAISILSLVFESSVSDSIEWQITITIALIIFDAIISVLFAYMKFLAVFMALALLTLPSCFIGIANLFKGEKIRDKTEIIVTFVIQGITAILFMAFLLDDEIWYCVGAIVGAIVSSIIRSTVFCSDKGLSCELFDKTICSEIVKINLSFLSGVVILGLLAGGIALICFIFYGIYVIIVAIVNFIIRYIGEIIGVGIVICCIIGYCCKKD